MSKERLLVFVDCNVLIEGLFVAMHPAAIICILAAHKQIDLVTCALVVEDIENEVLDRAGADDLSIVDSWTKFQKQVRLRVMPNPDSEFVAETKTKYLGIMRHSADIPVLAAAIDLGPDLILSDNTKHFNAKVSERCGIAIWSCEEFIANLIAGTLPTKLKV